MVQFHSMQAYIYDDGTTERFFSYKTLISEYRDGCLYVGRNFDCSATTRKQFSRYLSERFGLRYPDVKRDVYETYGTGEVRGETVKYCAAEDYDDPAKYKFVSTGIYW